MRGRGWVRRRAERAQVPVFYRSLTQDHPSASNVGGAEIRMDPGRGGLEPYGRMGRMPPAPSLPIPRYPFGGPVDPSPEILWQEIDNLVPSSLSILLPALNEENGVEAVMKRISTTLQRGGLSYSVYLLDGQSTDQTRAVAREVGAEVF